MKKPKSTPAAYSTVCPYLMVDDVSKSMDFIIKVFGATEKERIDQDGALIHGEASIGEVTIMIGKSSPVWPAQGAMVYVFVDNVDEVFQQALENGAQSMMPPDNREYGVREAGVKDPQNNQWWIAHSL